MDILFLLIGLLVGLGAGLAVYFVVRGKWAEKNQMLEAENAQLKTDGQAVQVRVNELMDERTSLVSRASVLENQRDTLDGQLAAERENHRLHVEKMEEDAKEQLAQERENQRLRMEKLEADAKEQIEAERRHAQELREQNEKQWTQKLEALKQELLKNAAADLAQRQDRLQETNRTQMDELLKPIKEQFEAFRKSVDESKTSNEVNKTELKASLEHAMQDFRKMQDEAVRSLMEQTDKIGNDAVNLTNALKGESKTQGDWGEMILETALENSGLVKDEEYFVQQNVKDEGGNNLRPDVVVKFPEGRSVVIDSKVSLTAYANAVAATNDADRERHLKEHVRSMKKHVDELAGKDYDKLVDNAIGFVLMFVPNDSGYVAAMKQDASLGQYAYKKGVIIISPSNLLITLRIVYNLWQFDRQTKNVDKIVNSATDLYEKVVGMTETFEDIGNQIGKLQNAYDKAHSQLYSGKGNVVRRLETLKDYGITPKKQLKGIEE